MLCITALFLLVALLFEVEHIHTPKLAANTQPNQRTSPSTPSRHSPVTYSLLCLSESYRCSREALVVVNLAGVRRAIGWFRWLAPVIYHQRCFRGIGNLLAICRHSWVIIERASVALKTRHALMERVVAPVHTRGGGCFAYASGTLWCVGS